MPELTPALAAHREALAERIASVRDRLIEHPLYQVVVDAHLRSLARLREMEAAADSAHGHLPACQEFPTGWLCVTACPTVWTDKTADPAHGLTVETGASLIAAERQRQIDREGYTPEHDAEHHHPAEFVEAAIAYASPNDGAALWPWEEDGFKPEVRPTDLRDVPGHLRHGSVRDLTKAGALIAAAIDRLLPAHGLVRDEPSEGQVDVTEWSSRPSEDADDWCAGGWCTGGGSRCTKHDEPSEDERAVNPFDTERRQAWEAPARSDDGRRDSGRGGA